MRLSIVFSTVFAALAWASTLLANQGAYERTLQSTALVIAGDASGTAVLVDSERRLLVTGYHVVGENKEVSIVFPDRVDGQLVAEGKHYRDNMDRLQVAGHVISRDPRRDLALVEIDHIPDDVRPIDLADHGPGPGQIVHVVGNPSFSDALWVYSSGSVRAVYRKQFVLDETQAVDARVIESQAPANPGDSGGPMTDDEGRLVGIVSGRMTDASLVSVAIAVEEVKSLLSGELRSVDTPIRNALDEAGLTYEVDSEGLFQITVITKGERKALVFCPSKTEEIGGQTFRRIASPSIVYEQEPPATLPNLITELNAKSRIGSWSTNKVGTNTFVNYAVTVDPDLAADRLVGMIRMVAAEADSLAEVAEQVNQPNNGQVAATTPPPTATPEQHTVRRPKLINRIGEPTETTTTPEVTVSPTFDLSREVVGDWHVDLGLVDGEAMEMALRLDAQGQMRLVLVRGTTRTVDLATEYSMEGTVIRFVANGKVQQAELGMSNDGRLVFTYDGASTLMKRITTEPAAAAPKAPETRPQTKLSNFRSDY